MGRVRRLEQGHAVEGQGWGVGASRQREPG